MDASKWMRRTSIALAGGLAVVTSTLSTGCTTTELETGYKFQRLGSSTASQRRAYYAGPFSPEAREAMIEGNGEPSTASRRPRPGM